MVEDVGIGELLRHLSDLFDRDAEQIYADMNTGVEYRARFTPVIRAIGDEALSISELEARIRITQGAISQTVSLMKHEGILEAVETSDQRLRKVALTELGRKIKRQLTNEWQLHIETIADLESEVGVPLRGVLQLAINALENQSYFDRIATIRTKLNELK